MKLPYFSFTKKSIQSEGMKFEKGLSKKTLKQNLKLNRAIIGKKSATYLLIGFFLGIFFPVIGTFAECTTAQLSFSLTNFLFVQKLNPSLWLVDTAPIFLGFVAYLAGKNVDRLNEKNVLISEKYQQMAELREIADTANKAKSDFLANMSHEIRTPMNAIIGMSYMLGRTELDDKQKDFNQKIDTSAKNLLRIINDILDFSKIEAGKLSLEVSPMNLEEVIAEVAATVNIKLQNKPAVELVTQIDPKIPKFILGDSVRLKQVLLNLADNAAKFTERGEITVTVKALQTMSYGVILNFSVRDTGIGLTEDSIKKLFQPFQQADASTTRKYGGTGLGLTISRKIVNMMDGELIVESIPNLGSIFSFNAYFSKPENEVEPIFNIGEKKGTNVLLVDDSESARIVLDEMLTSFGFQVTVCSSGFEAMNIYTQKGGHEYFSLLIVDWQMPGMDGMKLVKELKNNHTDIPSVLMVTAYGKEILKEMEGREFIDELITKPVNQSSLFDAVNNILKFGSPDLNSVTSKKEHIANLSVLKGKRVLVVEDNDINLEFATALLEAAEMKVTAARNGQESIDKIEKQKFDIVLMDIQMPEMDGLTATMKIRGDLKITNLPILAMTAHAMKGEREKSIAAGMNDHITKPIDPDFFYAKLIEYCTNNSSPKPVLSISETSLIESAGLYIRGIDTVSGLKRAAGNEEIYIKMLRSFIERYENFEAKIDLLIQQDRIDETGMLLHTVAGVSGNVGMKELYKSALEISNLLKEHIKLGHIKFNALQQHRLKEFSVQMNFYLDTIYEFLNSKKIEVLKDSDATIDDLATLIESLEKSLLENDLLSAERCSYILGIPGLNREQTEILENVQKLLNEYEFEQANTKLSQIKETI